jgi:adenosine deaminase
VLQTGQDFFELATGYLDRARRANVRRAEIFFDPQTHVSNGVPLEAVMEGLTGAIRHSERTHGISADLIMCFLRDRGAEAADQMLSAMLPFREDIIGVGLDSAEIGYPPELFAGVYARAAAEDLHLVAHAGEEAGPRPSRPRLTSCMSSGWTTASGPWRIPRWCSGSGTSACR